MYANNKISLYAEKAYVLSGWSEGAMVLGKIPVPGRPTKLD